MLEDLKRTRSIPGTILAVARAFICLILLCVIVDKLMPKVDDLPAWISFAGLIALLIGLSFFIGFPLATIWANKWLYRFLGSCEAALVLFAILVLIGGDVREELMGCLATCLLGITSAFSALCYLAPLELKDTAWYSFVRHCRPLSYIDIGISYPSV